MSRTNLFQKNRSSACTTVRRRQEMEELYTHDLPKRFLLVLNMAVPLRLESPGKVTAVAEQEGTTGKMGA